MLTPQQSKQIMDAATIIAFTGHREVAVEDLYTIERGFIRLEDEWDFGYPIFLENGCATGFDTLAYKRFWPHELINTFPHPVFQYQLDALLRSVGCSMDLWSVDQTACPQCFKGLWNGDKWALMKRNEHMVDRAKQVICYWNGVEKGGTWATIQYARKTGKPVRDIRDL